VQTSSISGARTCLLRDRVRDPGRNLMGIRRSGTSRGWLRRADRPAVQVLVPSVGATHDVERITWKGCYRAISPANGGIRRQLVSTGGISACSPAGRKRPAEAQREIRRRGHDEPKAVGASLLTVDPAVPRQGRDSGCSVARAGRSTAIDGPARDQPRQRTPKGLRHHKTRASPYRPCGTELRYCQ
jgi:hypothetical protein